MSSNPVVLIAGAGPSGLVAALSLLRNGIPIQIIDKSVEYHVGTRGAGIMPRTLEVFHQLGVIGHVRAARGMDAPPMCFYKLPGGVEILRQLPPMIEKLDPLPSIPYNHMWFVPQNDIERILRAEIEKCGAAVELGKELIDIQQTDGSVVATVVNHQTGKKEVINAKYLIGSDGAKGATRRILDLAFLGKTMDSDGMIVSNIVVDGLNTEVWHIWKDPETYTIAARPYDQAARKFVVVVTGPHDNLVQNVTEDGLRKMFTRTTGRTDVIFQKFEWLSYFQPNMRVVDSFAHGRVFLAGDAAHVHSPHGGQGLNTSVQDSFNLAWKLALACKGFASASLLQTYNEERLPVISDMLKQVIGLYNRGKENSSQAEPSRGKELMMLGINYRWSSIVVDETREPGTVSLDDLKEHSYLGWGDQLSAGDRAPDAPGLIDKDGHVITLFDQLNPAKHTILLFSTKNVVALRETVAKSTPSNACQTVFVLTQDRDVTLVGDEFVVVDRDGHLGRAYPQNSNDETSFIIRPDGFIGGVIKSIEGLEQYFFSILR
ncbi:FAD binding domain-containing protein [Collybia nuda]|uniref:FAD binding domain-containing protein n=1 Tax=Collybia nuda TaxID=64659 RepID=A0A9P5XVA3_9AGAR|nr:FAD binding domain-containing protein [Collybia nuda]